MNQGIYYKLIAEKIARATLEASSAAKTIDHSALAGSIREIALRNCIAPYLTHSFHCGTGKIIDTTGYSTKQIDLVVYEKKLAPPLMLNESLGIFPAECCEYAFEVKSTLTAAEIKSAIEVGRSVANLKMFPSSKSEESIVYEQNSIKRVLFAFDSDITGDEIERYLKYDDLQCSFSVLLVLGKGYWFWDEGWHGVSAKDFEDPAEIFSLFVTGFLNTLVCREASIRWFNPGSYILTEVIRAKPYLSESSKDT